MTSFQFTAALLLWIAVEAQSQNVIPPLFVKNAPHCNDSVLDKLIQKSWLLGEHNSGGFCNQLFGMFSSVALARLLGTNLILGPIRTRRSFATPNSLNEQTVELLPYSSFFNVSVYSNFWAKKGLQIIEKHEIIKCLNMSALLTLERPRFFSLSDDELLSMVKASNRSLPFSPGVGVQVGGLGMTALYNHLQSGEQDNRNRHLQQLADIHASLVPNNVIQ